jgi:hypothetical protein
MSGLMFSGELKQRRSFLPQTLEIDNFVVRGARLPALPDDPDPLESESAHGGMMLFALGVGPERRQREVIADFQLPIVDLNSVTPESLPHCSFASEWDELCGSTSFGNSIWVTGDKAPRLP